MTDRLLLIDHDPDTAVMIDRALDGAGFGVRRVATVQAGLEFLAGNPVAGIVLDHRPPCGDGLLILRSLREQRIASPIIMVSSLGSADFAVQAIKAGAYDLVEKSDHYLPLLVAKVREAIAEFVARATPGRVVRPVFVGRATELRALDEELSLAMAGEGRVALLVGEEGIGKTSLALEVTRLARARGTIVLWGQCHEAGGAPAYWPWIQVLRAYVRIADPGTLRDDLGDSAAAVGWILPMLRQRCADLPTADAAELTRFHVVDGVAQFLKRAAARRPLVLALDDLHRADGDSLYLFRWLATESVDAPLLLLGAYRDGAVDEPKAAELTRVASQPRTTVLHLEGFAVEDVRRYVEQATTVRPSEALAGAIHAKTEGNPLFVAEVARLLATDGRLSHDPENGRLRIAIPATRRQAIADRLVRLSEPCRRILGVAAVIGHDFACDLVARVANEESAAVQGALDEALAEHLVAASDDEPGVFKFVHMLVRQVRYEDLPPAERSRLHARVAETLEAGIFANGGVMIVADLPLAALAHHALEAATDADTLRRAQRWMRAAGDRAAAMMAHDEAARHYDLALQVSERAGVATPQRLHHLLLKLVEARQRAGDLRGAREAGRRALTVAKETSDPMMIAAAALAFAGCLPGFGAIVSDPEVVGELERALALLPSTATAPRAQVMARLSEELAYSPEHGAERALGQQAIELARSVGDPHVLAAVLRTTQWSVWTPDAIERRRQLATEIIALAQSTGDRVLGLDGELLRLWSALEHGDTTVAWQQLDLCTRLAGELRLPHYVWITAVARTGLHIATGSLDEAERLTEHARDAHQRSDDATIALFMAAQRIHVHALRGQLEDVAEGLRSIGMGFPLLSAVLECTLILTYARAGQCDRAQAALTAIAANDFERVPRTPGWLMNMTELAVACTVVGDLDIARDLYRHLAPFTSYNVILPPLLVLAPVAHYLGKLAVILGNESMARHHFEEALALEHRTGSRQYLALTQITYGQFLLRSRCPSDNERGARLIAAGRAIADELRLVPVVSKADATHTAPRSAAGRALFRLAEDTWQVEFQGQRATLPHRIGMTYLRCLLERPGTPIPALELASLGGDAILVDRNGGPLVDRRAMAEVQHRLAEIDAEIAACRQRGAVVSADVLQERADCAGYVGGRRTELVSAADRARSGVTKAIGRALKAIRGVHEGLGHHLDRHIETGRLGVYIPDPAAPVTFEF